MTKSQVVALLAYITAYDRRTTSEIDDEMWNRNAGDLDFEDAKDAVDEYFRNSKEWLMPVDVRRGVAAIRERRARRNGAPVGAGGTAEIPDADPDDTAAYLAAVREQRVRCGDQLTPRTIAALLASRPFRTVPALPAGALEGSGR